MRAEVQFAQGAAEELRVRLLYTVRVGEKGAVDQLVETHRRERRPDVDVDVAHDPDAEARRLEPAEGRPCVVGEPIAQRIGLDRLEGRHRPSSRPEADRTPT
jgi:hypothetical protein